MTIPELLRSEVESHESLIVREKDQIKSLKAYPLAFGRVGKLWRTVIAKPRSESYQDVSNHLPEELGVEGKT
jgi:hypothetical protein